LLLPHESNAVGVPHDNWFFSHYRAFLRLCINNRWLTIGAVFIMLVAAVKGFGFLPKNFFPDSTRPQFTIDVWLREGTHISTTERELAKISETVKAMEGVKDITTFIGGGAMRFILTYNPETPNSNYGQLLVDVDDYHKIKEKFIPEIQKHLEDKYPEATVKVEAFRLGPSGGAVEARFMGPDANVLRGIASQVENIMMHEPNARSIRNDWGERVKVASVQLAESRARKIGITRPEIGNTLRMTFDGMAVGVYREGEDLLPIMLRPPKEQRESISNLDNVQAWSSTADKMIPIEQVTDEVKTTWEDASIQRRNRMRTITVSCQQRSGTADTLFRKMRGEIEAIPLPTGYSLEWGGEYESSHRANRKLMANVPLAFSMMFFISVMLFNTLRHPVIIFLGLPMAIIGVTIGLLIGNQPFGFMATLGFLSLSGMLIKNEIVLLDQINLELATGKEAYKAIIDSGVSRVRPVSMAAFTTVLGMIPLIWDAFFCAMAVTIMAGLTFATLLTLVVVPVLYATFFNIHEPAAKR
ncbi:MAG: efflux RND transporter permease subunit, partial [Planctomycetes bacterium]|nr:efflux RND transporter permease subunit [Planctomycetota bacterium]